MEIKITGSKKAMKALEDFMLESKYEYNFSKVEPMEKPVEKPVKITWGKVKKMHTQIIEDAIKDFRKYVEDKVAEIEDEKRVATHLGINFDGSVKARDFDSFKDMVYAYMEEHGELPDAIKEYFKE